MPKERYCSASSAANVRTFINLRPTVVLPDVIASYKLMKSLNPEVVIAGHGQPTTTIIFDEYEGFYNLLMKRVGEMAAQGNPSTKLRKN